MSNPYECKGIIIINGSMCFASNERGALIQNFRENNSELFFLEQRSMQNSIFDGIQIIINNELVMAIFASGVYDFLKFNLTYIIKKIRQSEINLWRKDKNMPPLKAVLKIQTSNGEIIASIDKELTESETQSYIEAMIKAYEIANNTTNENPYYVIDEINSNELEILPLDKYLDKYKKL